VAQSVKRPTLDFGSGHDLRVVRSIPVSGSTLGWSLLGILSLPPPLPLLLLELSISKGHIPLLKGQNYKNGE